MRIIFPLALGAIDADTLAKQRELKDLEREHDRYRRELDARLGAARAWEAEVAAYYLQARALGLLPDSPPPDANWSLEKYILELQKLPDTVRKMDLPDVREGTNDAGVKELTGLINEEDRLGEEIGSLSRRLSKLDQLSSSVGEYGATLIGQEDRLQGIGWFEKKLDGAHECPVCGTNHTEVNPRLAELQTMARELKSLTASVRSAPPKLDQELAELRQQLRDREAAITTARQKRRILEARSAEFAAQRQRIRQIYLFIGRVEQALENVAASRNVAELREQVKALEEKIAELRRQLDPRAQQSRLSAALDAVSAKIASYAMLLQLEHANENVRLNVRELTLQFSPLSGRTDFLWEVGSGQNWVGYHVATLVALHEHFIRLGTNPVPEFLVVDQPSQVYFPEDWPSMDVPPDQWTDVDRSSDIEGVRRIFSALSHFLDAVEGEFQLIVTEHAGSITWDGIPHVHIVGNWRQGHDEFLIPSRLLKNT